MVCGQQSLSISERARQYCAVCNGGSVNDTVQLFHHLHTTSKAQQFSPLHTELTQALGTGIFQPYDTLQYYSELMLGKTLYALKLPRESIEAYEKVLEKWEGFQPVEQPFIWSEIASAYLFLQDYAQAMKYYQQVVQSAAFSSTPLLQDGVYVGIGLCFQNRKNDEPDSAILYYTKAMEVQIALNDSVDLARSYLNLGGVHYEQYRDAAAMEHWKMALQIAEAHHITDILGDVHYNLAQLYEEMGELAPALNHYQQYINYQDSLWNRDKLWELAQQKEAFEVQLREDEILLLEKDAALQEVNLAQRETERNTLIGIAGGLVAILLLIVLLYRTTAKKNKIIEAQRQHLDQLNTTKNQLFSIVAHDLRAPVQSLGSANKLLHQQVSALNDPQLEALLQRNQEGIEGTYRLLDNLLHWSLSQSENLFLQREQLALHAIIEQVLYDVKPLLQQRAIRAQNEVPNKQQVVADSSTLKIVLRNVLDNAIKFTPDGGIIVFQLEEATAAEVQFSITDSGRGIAPELVATVFEMPAKKERAVAVSGKTSSGLGLYLCKELMALNEGAIEVDAQQREGAKFIMRLKATL